MFFFFRYINRNKLKCMSKDECTSSSDGKWWIFGKECVNSCPPGYETKTEPELRCQPCDPCIKKCNITGVIDGLAKLQEFAGCTHLLQNLEIRILNNNNNTKEELLEKLREVRVINGYLKVSRVNVINSLDFLPNLNEIKGENLVDNRYAIYMLDNQNLGKLWNFDQKFNLTIHRGTIFFHYNPRLCYSEISKLANLTGIGKINDTDVSKISNGDKSRCNSINLKLKATNIDSHNVTIEWETLDTIETKDYVGYTLFYAEDEHSRETSLEDTCNEKIWNSYYTSNTSLFIKNLKPFTKYVYFVNVLSPSGGQSAMHYFTTLSDDPEMDRNTITAISHNSTAIWINWSPPFITNGILSYYQIFVNAAPDEPSFLNQRNFCLYPREPERQVKEPKTIIKIKDHSKCNCTKEEIHFVEQNSDEEFTLCDENSISKYGLQVCEKFKYENVNNMTNFITNESNTFLKYSIESQKKEVSSDRTTLINITDTNATSYLVTGLKHYQIYVFYIAACNQNRSSRPQCSGIVQVFNRTLPNPDADSVKNVSPSVSGSSVQVTWDEPEDPNSLIVAYNIKYERTADISVSTKPLCITKSQYSKYGYNISELSPGDYYIQVQAVSLAGPGYYSTKVYFTITYNSFWIYIILGILVFIIAALVIFYMRYKDKSLIDRLRLITNINPEYEGMNYERDEWEIPREDIEIEEEIGSGTFGSVFSGYIKSRNCPCAIKVTREQISLAEQSEFLTEASTMKKFSEAHHVVKLLGVVSIGSPALVVMELMDRGDLKNYLRKIRDTSHIISVNDMYKMAIEIADGMAYLAAKKFVHRDLAARNCMVAADNTVKIGDFGMTRDIYQSDYYRKESRGLMPVRWMAPESLVDGVFTSDSDVWSYGIVLWEIATLAEQPYQGLSNEQVWNFVRNRGVLDRPPECADGLYNIMKSCWAWKPMRRPSFLDIINDLQDRVGPSFCLMSFYHSREGKEYRSNHSRVYNPPALMQGELAAENVYSSYRVSDEDVSLHYGSE